MVFLQGTNHSLMMEITDYQTFFLKYQTSVHQLETDVQFWKYFLTTSIERYKKDNPVNRWIRQSGFSIYDIPIDGSGGWLKSSDMISSIEIDDLTSHNNNFFTWIMNLAVTRAYNLVELLLLQVIQFKYFPSLDPPLRKKQVNKLNSAIKDYLKANSKTIDTTNNRHILLFLKEKSTSCSEFLSLPVRIDWNTNWESFYELFSILRNIIAHDGMIINKDSYNSLKSVAKDMYLHFFNSLTDDSDSEILQLKNEEYFGNFLILVNDLAGNLIKFIAEKPDLKFIGLR